MDILVTIYILTYKKFDNVYQCIDSALNQTYGNIELILSDDGSPTFPEETIKQYIETHKHSNIKYYSVIANKINNGTVKHINNILRNAKGVLYIPLAGDDEFYDQDVVSKIVENYNSTHFNVLTTSRLCIDTDGNPICLRPHFKTRRIIEKMSPTELFIAMTEMKDMNFISGCAMVIAADFFKKFGMHDENFVLWEDGPFATKVLSKGYKIETDYDVISIIYRGGGVSSGGNMLMKKDMEYYNIYYRTFLIEQLGYSHKRRVSYINKRMGCSKILKIYLYIIFFDVIIDRFLYKVNEITRGKNDILYYQNKVKLS